MSVQRPRPWYCWGHLVDEYKGTLREGGESLPMLRALKILRAIIVNIGVIAIVLYSIARGADPTFLGSFGLAILAAYNGVELLDYAALLQAYKEVQTGSDSGED
ncbi:hypothetical protein [Halorubrum trueperi]|uniref:2TM domain-containing protein n=1 Tax=Halorubrum trueperi TaxID=2004704 RepID=A0ABD5UI83_9EURY